MQGMETPFLPGGVRGVWGKAQGTRGKRITKGEMEIFTVSSVGKAVDTFHLDVSRKSNPKKKVGETKKKSFYPKTSAFPPHTS